jgi:hypothetical protein
MCADNNTYISGSARVRSPAEKKIGRALMKTDREEKAERKRGRTLLKTRIHFRFRPHDAIFSSMSALLCPETWDPQGQGVRGVQPMVNTVCDRRIALLEDAQGVKKTLDPPACGAPPETAIRPVGVGAAGTSRFFTCGRRGW